MQQMGVSANVAFNTDPTTSMQQTGDMVFNTHPRISMEDMPSYMQYPMMSTALGTIF